MKLEESHYLIIRLTTFKATVIKTVYYLLKIYRSMEQNNSPKTDPHKYMQLYG